MPEKGSHSIRVSLESTYSTVRNTDGEKVMRWCKWAEQGLAITILFDTELEHESQKMQGVLRAEILTNYLSAICSDYQKTAGHSQLTKEGQRQLGC